MYIGMPLRDCVRMPVDCSDSKVVFTTGERIVFWLVGCWIDLRYALHNEPAKKKMSGFLKLTNFQRLNFMAHLFMYGCVVGIEVC